MRIVVVKLCISLLTGAAAAWGISALLPGFALIAAVTVGVTVTAFFCNLLAVPLGDARSGGSPPGLPPTFKPQGWFRRWFAAAIIDFFIVAVPYALLTRLPWGVVAWCVSSDNEAPGHFVHGWLGWANAAMLVVVFFAYFTAFEARMGTTPGKWVYGMRVVAESGERPTVGAVVVRNLYKLPALLLPGVRWFTLLTVIFSKDSRRLGDKVAHTYVVRDVARRHAVEGHPETVD